MSAASVHTQLRGPWPGHPMKDQPTRQGNKTANLDAIVKTRAPYSGTRVSQGSKWDELFQGASEGDCWEMPPEETARAERALRQWLKKAGIDGIVRRRSRCEDGKGRVWLYKVLKPRGVQ